MKPYDTLIKLKKRDVDALRRQLSALQERRQVVTDRQEALSQALAEEVRLAGELVDMGVFFGDYSAAIEAEQATLNQTLATLDRQLDTLAEKLHAVYSEQKMFECVRNRKLLERRKAEAHAEQAFLDEQARRRHSRGTVPYA